ncbi:MAG: hydrolase [Litorimonas sp.]
MRTDTLPRMNMSTEETGCCPRFDPEGWEGLVLRFEGAPFVRATTRSLLHVPLDMGSVFDRVQKNIAAADAQDPHRYLILSRDLSATRAEHFFAVTRDVPGEEMTELTGTFRTRVFEGPYRKARAWHDEMAVLTDPDAPGRTFMFYTTCPRCVRRLGRNYVVGFAEAPSTPDSRSYERWPLPNWTS